MRNIDLFDDYLNNKLDAQARMEFELQLGTNEEFRKDFLNHKQFISMLENYGKEQEIKSEMNFIHKKEFGESNIVPLNDSPNFIKRYGKLIGVAASVAIIAVTATITLLSAGGYLIKQHQNTLTDLSKEVVELKSKQNGIIDGILSVKQKSPVLNANYQGTAFLINKKGYILTCLHMVKGADSVFVINSENNSIRAHVVLTDNRLDVAVLKLESEKGFAEVPYTLKSTEAELGEKVFTLGFPSDDIVYGEGTIASHSGQGDAGMYQISIPVNPGNSGGPLLDENGNIIGIIKGKNSSAEGTGFAVKADGITKMLATIEDANLKKDLDFGKKNLLKNSKRKDQIKRLSPCIYNVKVFRKN